MKIQSLRGFHDTITYEESEQWTLLRQLCCQVAQQYGYHEVQLPLLEASDLYVRSIGGNSDIVHKEMYSFEDKGESWVSLRPEGTAGCVRACIEHNLLYDGPKKFFYLGPMFRRERPQKGRLRQFHQFGVEALGYQGYEVDVEQILMIADILKQLQLPCSFDINFLAGKKSRQLHRDALRQYYKKYLADFSDIELKRYHENPLRLLDSKSEMLTELNKKSPLLSSFYSREESESFKAIQHTLDALEISYQVDSTLVRGLDYYSGLVYECKSQNLGAQSALCGGGRYDYLFEQLSDKSEPATGFSIGLERLSSLVTSHALADKKPIRVYWALTTELSDVASMQRDAQVLRQQVPKLVVHIDYRVQKLKQALKRADRQNYDWLITEQDSGYYALKSLSLGQQYELTIDACAQLLQQGGQDDEI